VNNELILQFVTGGDDLRGGDDNVNLLLLLQSGNPLRFDNVNGRKRWPDHSSQTVSLSPLPDTVRFEDIKGVRLETTFGGGLGGDNWNLDRLAVSARIEGETRELFDQGGAPLFRFTGDRRVREFAFSTVPITPITPQPAVKTPFNPASDGFKFANRFENIVVSELDITTSGLCGGMSYAALDYFFAGIPIPQQDYMPAEGTPLQRYLYDRQVTSLTELADKWAEYGFNPGGARNREFFNWGLQAGSGRLGELISYIDQAQPVPLGLLTVEELAPQANHQVLAIGYELGRYIGDLGEHIEDLSIFICDPNFPEQVMTLKPDVAAAMYIEKDDTGTDTGKRWRTYFVDTKYTRKTPPAISASPNELLVEFVTGDDDLRGGNDNVHLFLLLRDQGRFAYANVNNGKRWIEHSSQTVNLFLPDTIRFDDIEGVRVETTFGGGLGGDNWNLDKLVVKARVAGTVNTILSKEGTPLFRFTGNQHVSEFRR
jgi:hypothetical protein